MRLVRYTRNDGGRPVPGVLDADGVLRDAASWVPDWDGPALHPQHLARFSEHVPHLPRVIGGLGAVRLAAPVARPGKVVCIEVNYAGHGTGPSPSTPAGPVVSLKDPWTVVGHRDTVLVPRGSTGTAYEVELAVVIGVTARYLRSPDEALTCVAGYATSHDVSERTWQQEGAGGWGRAASCETFNPLGPWLLTADEVADPQVLELELSVNGDRRQQGSTAQMVLGVADLVHHLSQRMVLHPGDVINTGSPAFVGLGRPGTRPYLREGDLVECSITGPGGVDLGRHRTSVGQA